MIEVSVFHSSSGICAFSMKGHSGYGEEGTDIVCAAVSAIAQYVIEALSHTLQLPCLSECREGLITFSFTEEATASQRKTAQPFLITLERTMQELSIPYGAYLKICSLEV